MGIETGLELGFGLILGFGLGLGLGMAMRLGLDVNISQLYFWCQSSTNYIYIKNVCLTVLSFSSACLFFQVCIPDSSVWGK